LPGQFLLKDAVLLGAAIWSLGESLTSVSMRGRVVQPRITPERQAQGCR
jgi:hypothetical protein